MEKVKKSRERHMEKRGTYTEKKNYIYKKKGQRHIYIYIYIYIQREKRGTTREWGKGCIQ